MFPPGSCVAHSCLFSNRTMRRMAWKTPVRAALTCAHGNLRGRERVGRRCPDNGLLCTGIDQSSLQQLSVTLATFCIAISLLVVGVGGERPFVAFVMSKRPSKHDWQRAADTYHRATRSHTAATRCDKVIMISTKQVSIAMESDLSVRFLQTPRRWVMPEPQQPCAADRPCPG